MDGQCIIIHDMLCAMGNTFTERMPTAEVLLYIGLSKEAFRSESANFIVLEGQEFGLVCKTDRFTANWININGKSSEH